MKNITDIQVDVCPECFINGSEGIKLVCGICGFCLEKHCDEFCELLEVLIEYHDQYPDELSD